MDVLQDVTRVCITFVPFDIPLIYFDSIAIKLSYIMSQFYEANNRDGQACSFSGNGTVNPLAPTSASAANAAASSCISDPNAVFTPAAPTGGSNNGSPSGSSTGAPTKGSSGAVNLVADGNAVLGMAAMALFGIASAVWTLA